MQCAPANACTCRRTCSAEPPTASLCAPTVPYRHHILHLHAINPHVASVFEGHAHLSAGSGWLVRRQEAPLLHGRQGSLQ